MEGKRNYFKKFKLGKKGDIDSLWWIISVFICIIFLVAVKYAWALIFTQLQSTDLYDNPEAQKNLEKVDKRVFSLFDAFFMIFGIGMMIATIILAYALRTSPVFIILLVIFTIVEVIIAVPLSNTYMDAFTTNTQLTDTINTFPMANYFMQYLPFLVAVFNLIVGIVMYGLGRIQE